MRSPAIRVRRFDCNGPRFSVRSQAERAHFTVNPDKGVSDPVVAERLGQPIHAIALGDAVEIERDGRGLAHLIATDLQHLMRRAARGVHSGADCIRRGSLRPEAPPRHGVSHADVKGPVRHVPNLQPEAQDLLKSIRNRHPFRGCRCIKSHQVAVGPPGGHLSIHFIDDRLQRRLDRRRVKAWLREEQCRPTRAHSWPVQRMACALSKHLQHTVPPSSELLA